MTNMTLAIPDQLHRIMKQHTEIKWSEVARRAIQAEATKLAIVDKILEKSKFTEDDAQELARKVRRGIATRHGLAHETHY